MPKKANIVPAAPFLKTFNVNEICLPSGRERSQLPSGEIRAYSGGEIVIDKGVVPNSVFILREGTAVLLFFGAHGELLTARPVESGEMLGLTESIAGAPFNACLKAVTECRIESFEIEEFIGLLKTKGDLLFNVLRRLAIGLQECLIPFKISSL